MLKRCLWMIRETKLGAEDLHPWASSLHAVVYTTSENGCLLRAGRDVAAGRGGPAASALMLGIPGGGQEKGQDHT